MATAVENFFQGMRTSRQRALAHAHRPCMRPLLQQSQRRQWAHLQSGSPGTMPGIGFHVNMI
jgi:hypothetical protein